MALEVGDAVEIMLNAHWGQKDKNGEPYVYHPWRVCGRLPLNLFITQTASTAALLHDVLEDTDWTETDLKEEGADNFLIKVLKLLEREEAEDGFKEDYFEYINRIVESQNKIAIEVKKADLMDNLREGCPDSLRSRYYKALRILEEA